MVAKRCRSLVVVAMVTVAVAACTSDEPSDPVPTSPGPAALASTPAAATPTPTPTPTPLDVVDVVVPSIALPMEGRAIRPGTADQPTWVKDVVRANDGLIAYVETYEGRSVDRVEVTAHRLDGEQWVAAPITGLPLEGPDAVNFHEPIVRLPESGDWFMPVVTGVPAWGYRSSDGLAWDQTAAADDIIVRDDALPSPITSAVVRDGQVFLAALYQEVVVLLRGGDDLQLREVASWPNETGLAIDAIEVAQGSAYVKVIGGGSVTGNPDDTTHTRIDLATGETTALDAVPANIVRWGDTFLGAESRDGDVAVVVSDDLETWMPMPGADPVVWGGQDSQQVAGVANVDGVTVIWGDENPAANPYERPVVWWSTDDASWQRTSPVDLSSGLFVDAVGIIDGQPILLGDSLQPGVEYQSGALDNPTEATWAAVQEVPVPMATNLADVTRVGEPVRNADDIGTDEADRTHVQGAGRLGDDDLAWGRAGGAPTIWRLGRDGLTQPMSLPHAGDTDATVWTVAVGAEGLMAVGGTDPTATVLAWASADGTTWTPVEAVEGLEGEAHGVVANGTGWRLFANATRPSDAIDDAVREYLIDAGAAIAGFEIETTDTHFPSLNSVVEVGDRLFGVGERNEYEQRDGGSFSYVPTAAVWELTDDEPQLLEPTAGQLSFANSATQVDGVAHVVGSGFVEQEEDAAFTAPSANYTATIAPIDDAGATTRLRSVRGQSSAYEVSTDGRLVAGTQGASVFGDGDMAMWMREGDQWYALPFSAEMGGEGDQHADGIVAVDDGWLVVAGDGTTWEVTPIDRSAR